jgi:hypothetical protein
LGSGGCGGGSRFDPPDNGRPLQRALWLKGLADFPQGSMHDQVDDNGAEERGFELLSFLELWAGWLAFSQHARPDGRQVMLKTIPDVPDLYSRRQRYCRIPPDKSAVFCRRPTSSPAPPLSASMERISDR